jgi:hypothetical protein
MHPPDNFEIESNQTKNLGPKRDCSARYGHEPINARQPEELPEAIASFARAAAMM